MPAQCYPDKAGFFWQVETNHTGIGRQPSPPVSIHSGLGVCLALGKGEADAASASFGVRDNTKQTTRFLSFNSDVLLVKHDNKKNKGGCLIQAIGRIIFALLIIIL